MHSVAHTDLGRHPITPPRRKAGVMAEIEFLVKNPSRPAQEDIRIRVPAAGTVRDVKLRLQEGYPGHPEPATITVSHWEGAGEAGEGGESDAAGQGLLCPYVRGTPCRCRPPLRSSDCWHTKFTLRLPPPVQAIYAGRVLKDDDALLADFVVPVSNTSSSCACFSAARVAP